MKQAAYQTYQKLGQELTSKNRNQAYLCYENAAYLYKQSNQKNPAVVKECKIKMDEIKQHPDFTVQKTAIVLLSCNHLELTKKCVESIKNTIPGEAYQIIVVDNASKDGSLDWLRQQPAIRLIENQKNMGFPYGCNQGIAKADEADDIFLLNNDTVMTKNALFWLRMGLYQNLHIGAAGSVSNNAVNYQQIPKQLDTLADWLAFAEKNNVPIDRPYEKKAWLMGYAMLIKRSALEKIRENGEVLDTRFSPGNYEDNDLGLRLLQKGYQLLLCKNSFIYHHGGKTFAKQSKDYLTLLLQNHQKLEQKYQLGIAKASHIELDLLKMIKPPQQECFILEVGCRLGTGLARLESQYPQIQAWGIEKDKFLADLAVHVAKVEHGDFLETEYAVLFDHIMLNDIIHSKETSAAILTRAKRLLKPDGSLLVSVYNTQCVKCSAAESGLSLDEITVLFQQVGLQLQDFHYRRASLSPAEEARAEALSGGRGQATWPLYIAEKYIFEAKEGFR